MGEISGLYEKWKWHYKARDFVSFLNLSQTDEICFLPTDWKENIEDCLSA